MDYGLYTELCGFTCLRDCWVKYDVKTWHPMSPLFTHYPSVASVPAMSMPMFIKGFGRLLGLARLPAHKFSGHSFRAGGATEASAGRLCYNSKGGGNRHLLDLRSRSAAHSAGGSRASFCPHDHLTPQSGSGGWLLGSFFLGRGAPLAGLRSVASRGGWNRLGKMILCFKVGNCTIANSIQINVKYTSLICIQK